MRAWLPRTMPDPARDRAPGLVHDTATGRARLEHPGRRAGRPGSTSAASRRTTPPTSGTPRRTSPSTCSTGPGATPATRSPTCRTSPTSTTRCWSGPREGRHGLGGAGRARDRAVPRGHDRPAGAPARRTTSARSSRSRSSIDADRAARRAGAVYEVEDDLYFSVTADPRLRRRVRLRPRADAAGLRRARRRPRPARQEGPARLPACGAASARASRPGTARSGRGRPGWHIECTAIAHGAPRWRLRRPGRRQRPGLPAPRDVRRRRPRSPPRAARSPRPTSTPAWSATTARRCRSPAATWSSSPRCATARSTRWRSGWPCCATTTAATGSGPTPSSSTAWTRWPGGAGRSPRRRGPRRARGRGGARGAGRRPRRPARAPCRAWARAPTPGDGREPAAWALDPGDRRRQRPGRHL